MLTTKSTSTPLELDQIYQSIDDSRRARYGAIGRGRWSRCWTRPREEPEGQGTQFQPDRGERQASHRHARRQQGGAFGTARQVERFVNALATNNGTVRRFNDSLASAADLLKDERSDLAGPCATWGSR